MGQAASRGAAEHQIGLPPRESNIAFGWNADIVPISFLCVLPDPLPLSPRRFQFVWKLFKSWRAEVRGDFECAIRQLDEAAEIIPLSASDRVQRAMLLLRSQRNREAHIAFAALRDEFKGSQEPDLQYLRHFCTGMVSALQPGSAQWMYEAKQAQKIKCRSRLKSRFPMVTADEIWERVQPRS